MAAAEPVPVSEFRKNMNAYLRSLPQHDLELTSHGRAVAHVSSPADPDRMRLVDELAGCVKGSRDTLNAVRASRLGGRL